MNSFPSFCSVLCIQAQSGLIALYDHALCAVCTIMIKAPLTNTPTSSTHKPAMTLVDVFDKQQFEMNS